MIIKLAKKIRDKVLSPLIYKVNHIESKIYETEKRLEYIQEALGRVEYRQLELKPSQSINDNEYRVFSQWGEDGIIQFLLKNINIENKVFIEFGVEDYTESNTRFLLINNNWTGLVIDGSHENIKRLKSNRIYWSYNLKAVQEFVTKDNINQIIEDNGISGEIGLLSIDIDGNDYWIWDAIHIVSPIVVIIEYNHRFGKDHAVTIPYDEKFIRAEAHHSMIYFGASLKAVCLLAEKKGYTFVGCNSNGVNAFFVRKDMKPETIKAVSTEDGYIEGKFCEFRDQNGNMTKILPQDEKDLITSLPLLNLESKSWPEA